MINVGFPLAACEKLGIHDQKFQGMVFRFCKLYEQEKMIRIINKARSHNWHLQSPGPSFMKAVGEINKEDKNGLGNLRSV